MKAEEQAGWLRAEADEASSEARRAVADYDYVMRLLLSTAPPEPVTRVWAVFEHPKGKPRRSGYLYGVFASEEAARAHYGTPDNDCEAEFVSLQVSP